MIIFWIMSALMVIMFLMVIRGFSNSYTNELVRLKGLLGDQIIEQIDNIITYGQEQSGWRNNFPSVLGTEKSTLFIGKNFILVSPISSFPFIFRSALQPFLISIEPDALKAKLGFDRVFRPINIKTSNYGGDLELTIKPKGLLGEIKIHLTFENLGKKNIERIFGITNWG